MLVKSEAFSLLIHHHRLRTNSTSTTACELCLQCRGCILILTSAVLSELDLGDVRTRILFWYLTMARMTALQGLVLVLALVTLLDVTLAVEHVVGGDVQQWAFLHSNDPPALYNDWAANQTFKTGDTLLFEYDNTTHSVLQVVEADYKTCNLGKPINKWFSGNDSVFLSNAGTFYYICGTPSHCAQGMAVAITATGATVAAPPPPPAAIAPSPASLTKSHAAPGVTFSFASSVLLLAISHAALVWL